MTKRKIVLTLNDVQILNKYLVLFEKRATLTIKTERLLSKSPEEEREMFYVFTILESTKVFLDKFHEFLIRNIYFKDNGLIVLILKIYKELNEYKPSKVRR